MRDVFDDDDMRLAFVNDSGELSPQARPFSAEPGAASSDRDILAWEPATNKVSALQVVGSSFADINNAPVGLGPVLLENKPRERLTLYLVDGTSENSGLGKRHLEPEF